VPPVHVLPPMATPVPLSEEKTLITWKCQKIFVDFKELFKKLKTYMVLGLSLHGRQFQSYGLTERHLPYVGSHSVT